MRSWFVVTLVALGLVGCARQRHNPAEGQFDNVVILPLPAPPVPPQVVIIMGGHAPVVGR